MSCRGVLKQTRTGFCIALSHTLVAPVRVCFSTPSCVYLHNLVPSKDVTYHHTCSITSLTLNSCTKSLYAIRFTTKQTA